MKMELSNSDYCSMIVMNRHLVVENLRVLSKLDTGPFTSHGILRSNQTLNMSRNKRDLKQSERRLRSSVRRKQQKQKSMLRSRQN